MRPAPSGRRVASGHLRVDADKAIAKLREYQLADRSEWILEAIRGLICLGATSISVRGDANDVWLDWIGPPLERVAVPDLLDELVSPAGSRNRARRLIASALNSALGMDSSYVDIVVIEEGGEAFSTRFDPSLFQAVSGTQEDTLIAPVAAPNPGPGGRIHLRRSLGSEVLHYLFVGPPELRLVADRCRDLSIPIDVNGEPILRTASPLRVAFELGRSAYVEFAEPSPKQNAGAVLVELAERGVVLQRYALEFLPLPSALPLPFRVFVDADRLPTNASRSEVRRDLYPVAQLEDLLTAHVAKLLEELCSELEASPEVASAPTPARDRALQIIATQTQHDGLGAARENLLLRDSGLLNVPLLRDACGTARPVLHRWGRDLHRGRKRHPPELQPWLDDVVWLERSDSAKVLFGNALPSGRTGRRRARLARRALGAQNRFLQGRQEPLVVEPLDDEIARCPIGAHVPNSAVAHVLNRALGSGIRGEFVLTRRSRSIRLLYMERLISTLDSSLPTSICAVVNSPSIRPRYDFQGVDQDAGLAEVIDVLAAQTVAITEAFVCREDGEDPGADFVFASDEVGGDLSLGKRNEPRSSRSLVRTALALTAKLPAGIAPLVSSQERPSSPLQHAAAWKLASGGFASLSELRKHAVIGATHFEVSGKTPFPGRPIVVIHSASEQNVLRHALADSTRIVTYDRSHLEPVDLLHRATFESGSYSSRAYAVECSAPNMRGVVVFGPNVSQELVLAHGGEPFRSKKRKSKWLPAFIWAEVDDASPDWDERRQTELASAKNFSFKIWETAAVASLGRAVLAGDIDAESERGELLFGALAKMPKVDRVLGEELFEKLRAAKLFRSIDRSPVSATDLEASFEKSIFMLSEFPDVVPPDWQPVVGERVAIAALKRLTKRRIVSGKSQLSTRVATHKKRLAKEEHARWVESRRSLPLYELPLPGVVVKTGTKRFGGTVAVGTSPDRIVAHLTIDGRHFKTRAIPSRLALEAIVSIPPEFVEAPFLDISDDRKNEISELCRRAVGRLLCAIAAESPESLTAPGPARRLAANWFATGPKLAVRRAVTEIRTRPLFRSLRRGMVSCEDAGRPWSQTETSEGGLLKGLGEIVGMLSLLEPEPMRPDVPVAYARFDQEWIGGSSEFDETFSFPIVRFDPAEEFGVTFHALVEESFDVTEQVHAEQLRRRVAKGILDAPTVEAAAELKRSIAELDPDLGAVGEIGLSTNKESLVSVRRGGDWVSESTIETGLPVHLNVEVGDGDFDRWSGDRLLLTIENLTGLLLDQVVEALGAEGLPEFVRRALVRALLKGNFPSNQAENWKLFKTLRGRSESVSALVNQQANHGDIWYTTTPGDAQPLDSARIVLVLDLDDIEGNVLANSDFRFVHAGVLLAEDAVARRKLATPRTRTIALAPSQLENSLAMLEREGKTLKSISAPLSPESASLRGLSVYYDGIYLGDFPDPCRWPTATVIESTWINPTRTLDGPKNDERWKQTLRDVRIAADAAEIISAPQNALASTTIHAHEGTIRLRGECWLESDLAPGGIHIPVGGRGVLFTPSVTVHGLDVPLPIVGKLISLPMLDELGSAGPSRVATRAYRFLIHLLAQEQWKAEAKGNGHRRAHLAYAFAAGVVSRSKCTGVVFPEIASDRPLDLLNRFIKERLPLDWVKSADEAKPNTIPLIGEETPMTIALAALARLWQSEAVAVDSFELETSAAATTAASNSPPSPHKILEGALSEAISRLAPFPVDVSIDVNARSPLMSLTSIDSSLSLQLAYSSETQRLAEGLAQQQARFQWLVDHLALHALAVCREFWIAEPERKALEAVAKRSAP